MGQVGRESLAEPDVVPVVGGHGIAEPLVDDLVGHGVFDGSIAIHESLAVEDVARILHPAVPCLGLHAGELAIGVGADVILEKFHDPSGSGKVVKAVIAILGIHPGLDRHPVMFADLLDGEVRDPDHHQVGRERDDLLPVSEPQVTRQIGFFDKQTAGDGLVMIRHGDDEFARRLVGRVIQGRKPVPGPVGKVVAEERTLIVLVLGDDKPIRRNA